MPKFTQSKVDLEVFCTLFIIITMQNKQCTQRTEGRLISWTWEQKTNLYLAKVIWCETVRGTLAPASYTRVQILHLP